MPNLEPPSPAPAAPPSPPRVAGSVQHTARDEQRQRMTVRNVASRFTLALAVLGLISTLAHRTWRLVELMEGVIPGVGLTTARTTLVLVSTVLIFTARGLRRGHRLAWIAAVSSLALSSLLHLVKGLDLLVAAIVALAAVWLARQSRAFPVLPSRRDARRALGAVVVAAALLSTAVAIAGFLISTHRLTAEQFEVGTHHARTVTFVLTLGFVAVLLWTVTSPRRPQRLSAADHRAERERARQVVQRHGGGTLDYFALRDDKDWFFVGDSVVAHSVRAGVCLVAPDPIGPADERELVWSEFRAYAEDFGWSLAVIGASEPWLPLYEASGLRTLYLGDEAVVDCTDFTLAGGANKSLRQAVGRVEKAGYVTTFHDPAALDPALTAAITAMAAESRRGDGERGYSMTLSRLFDPADTGMMLSVTRTADGRVDAFCQWAPASDINGWSLDVMRRRLDVDDIPNGLIDATIVHTITHVRETGGRGLGLNFAVMREVLQGESELSRIEQLARPLLLRLSQSTQMSSLGSFNEKFSPRWVPRYAVLDAAEYVATQALAMADAEGVTELPVIGRFFGTGSAAGGAS